MQYILFCLTSFTEYNYFENHPWCNMYQQFIPFYCLEVFHCMDIPQSFYPFTVDGHLGCCWFWAIAHKISMSSSVYIVLWVHSFISLGCSLGTHKNGKVGLYGKCKFNIIGNCKPVIESGCSTLHPHLRYMRFSFASLLHFWNLYFIWIY